MPRHLNITYGKEAYKASGLQETRKNVATAGKPRKQLLKFGYLEMIVLEFSKQHVLVEASHVRAWARKVYGKELKLRRIHDSIKRLVDRGILERVEWGVYRLTDYGRKVVSMLTLLKKGKESECLCASSSSGCVGVKSSGFGFSGSGSSASSVSGAGVCGSGSSSSSAGCGVSRASGASSDSVSGSSSGFSVSSRPSSCGIGAGSSVAGPGLELKRFRVHVHGSSVEDLVKSSCT
jgi:hypothetical protein